MTRLLLLTSICLGQLALAQSPFKTQQLDDDHSIEDLVKVLEGEGIVLMNITSNQSDQSTQLAKFRDDTYSLTMEEGLIMSTGSASEIARASQVENFTSWTTKKDTAKALVRKLMHGWTIGDDDLNAFPGISKTHDACVVEMDLVPLADMLSFRYAFASDEYDEFVGTPFNDAFAFFISGPGITGKKNMAVLPNGDRITVNSVNNGNPDMPEIAPSNSSFYMRNEGQIKLEFDGLTRTLEVNQPVQAFQTYHLKIVIADVGDMALDSGVLLEAQSIHSYAEKYTIPFGDDLKELSERSKSILDGMLRVAEKHPEHILQIVGHADGNGSDQYNLELAQERINTVTDYIFDRGFSEKNYIEVNKGESMPVASNDTEEGRAQNRRVELKLIPSYKQTTVTTLTAEFQETTEAVIELKQNIPNPTGGMTTVHGTNFNGAHKAELLLSSMTGAIMDRIPFESGIAQFDVSAWNTGLYNYTLMLDGKPLINKRMVVSR